MPKFFTKTQFIAFLASFFITLIVGFFAWDFAGNVINKVLSYAEKISAEVFTASITGLRDSSSDFQQAVLPEDNNIKDTEIVTATAEDKQDSIDDILEKIDMVSAQIQDLQNQQKPDIQQEDQKPDEEIKKDEEKKDESQNENNKDKNIINYPKIIISKVQIASATSEKEEFVELYNTNGIEVDLTDWYLQRKTKDAQDYSTFVSSSLFSGKKISANGHFLICREGYYFNGLCNIFTENPLTENNSLVLKNPNREISDEFLTPASPAVVTGGGGGGSAPAVYPKVLISEVQVAPINQRFVELYNPNSADVNLTDWYLQRKTKSADSWGSFVSSIKFEGKTIPANGYFLISRELENSDVLFDITLSDSNSLALKNPSGDISDMLLATASPSLGHSIGRKVLSDETEKDTDNNSEDFEIQTPTPKAKNIPFIEPPIPELASLELTITPSKTAYFVGDLLDISGLVVTGKYSDGSSQIEPIMLDNIIGFDSSKPATGEILTITFEGKTVTYEINVLEAPVATTMQLKIISLPQAIAAGSPSTVFTVETQDASGTLAKVLSTTYVNLSSDSSTGLFASAPATGPCGSDWTKTSVTISKNTAHKSFCYEDSTPGTFTISIYSTDFLSDSQTIIIGTTSPSNLLP